MLSPVPASWIFWAVVVVCTIAQAAILRSTLLSRGPAPTAPTPTPHLAGELLWVLLPAAVLALTLVLTWRAMQGS